MFSFLMLVLVGLVSSLASPLDPFSTALFQRDIHRGERLAEVLGWSLYDFLACLDTRQGSSPPRDQSRHEDIRYYLDNFCANKEERYECFRDAYTEHRDSIEERHERRFNLQMPYLFDTLAGLRHVINFVCQRKEVILRNAGCLQGLHPDNCNVDPHALFRQYQQPDSGIQVSDVMCNSINSTTKCFGRVASQCDPQLEELIVDAGEMLFDGCTDDFSRA